MQNIIEKIKKFNDAFKVLLVTTTLLLMTMVLVTVLVSLHSDKQGVVVIDNFSTVNDANGIIDGKFIARAIYNEIANTNRKAITEKESRLLKNETGPSVEFEFQGVSVTNLMSVIDYLFPNNSRHVSGQVATIKDQLFVLISIDGQNTISLSSSLKDTKNIISEAAERVLEKTDPYVLARRLMLKDNIDHLRIKNLISRLLTNIDPLDDFWAMNLWGNLLVEEGKYSRAIEKYDVATKIAMKTNRTLAQISRSNKAGALISLKKYSEALNILEDKSILQYYNTYLMLGMLYYHTGQYEKAEGYMFKSVKMNPYDPEANNLLGRVLHENGKYTEAIEHLLHAYFIYRDQGQHLKADRTIFRLGLAYEEIGEDDAVARIYQRGLTESHNPANKELFKEYLELYTD